MKQLIVIYGILLFFFGSKAGAADCRPPMSYQFCQSNSYQVAEEVKPAEKSTGEKTPWWKKKWNGLVQKVNEVKEEVVRRWSDPPQEAAPEEKKVLPTYVVKDKGIDRKRLDEILRLIAGQKVIERIEDPNVKSVEFTLPDFALAKTDYAEPEALASPKAGRIAELETKPAVTAAKYEIPSELRVAQGLAPEAVESFTVPAAEDIQLQLHQVPEVSEKDVLHLIGQLLKASGKCHFAVGVLNDDSTEMVECLFDMGLYQLSLQQFDELVKSGKDHSPVLKKWLMKAPRELREPLGELLSRVKDVHYPDAATRSRGYYYQALYHLGNGKTEKAVALANLVDRQSDVYPAALLVKAILQNRFDDLDREIIGRAKSGDFSSEERALFLGAAGGLAFQNKKYDEAVLLLKKMTKDDFNWIESLVKLGWAQLLSKDPEGAIGNMYSLHTPFFQDLYLPESFVVRTIGYLDICQYGDAYKTLTFLEQRYRPWLQMMEKQLAEKSGSEVYLSYFQEFLRQEKKRSYGHLPHEVVRELIRQRDVIHLQKQIVRIDDERRQYDFILKLMEKDMRAEHQRDFKDVKDKQGQVVRTVSRGPVYQQRYEILRNTVASFEKRKTQSLKNLTVMKSQVETQLGRAMKSHLARLAEQLVAILDNNEFLRFEVFSGSGENLRALQQGMVKDRRIHRSVKPQNKDLQWAFSGEMWLDEIGHYRSSLKNNCANRVAASVKERKVK